VLGEFTTAIVYRWQSTCNQSALDSTISSFDDYQ